MVIKKAIYLLIFFITANISAYGQNTEETDNSGLRTMFQNNQAVIYSLNIRTFNANDKNGNGIIDFSLGETSGSFINAIERLDELKSLGINTIHLLPITPTGKIKALGTAGSLYSMADFTSLNLQLSDSQSDLSLKNQAKKFFDECHKRNIKVIVDLPSCGAYDLYINRPDLFAVDEQNNPVIPADWTDVRLFYVPNDNKKLFKSDIYILHKFFIDYMINLGADGIRADVATIKPYNFWHELIKYARSKKKDFLFLAEASESWKQPASDKAYFTDYKKLLEAGFDGYYGDYFNLNNWETSEPFYESIITRENFLTKYDEKKSTIGSFETHDIISPLLFGGENYSKIIIWLNATLPLNPYYVDGFLQGDDYLYNYSNKKASETYTDDEYYYVHQGQIDIFNFSRKPTGDTSVLIDEQKLAMDTRNKNLEQITHGQFIKLNSNNNKIFAYQRVLNNRAVTVIINRNLAASENACLKIKNITKKSKINFIKDTENKNLVKSTLNIVMKPAQIVIFTIEN